MKVSVVLSTYNAPDWLEKTLWGYARQDHPEIEIVIADDGSTEETRLRIARIRDETDLEIRHVWHEDLGFRKPVILNEAIVAAGADYLLFSDGDCIPRRDLVSVHADQAEPRHFLSGGYFKLPRDVSESLSRAEIESGRFADPDWLRSRGVPGGRRMLKLSTHGWVARLLDATTPTRPTWNGHNVSGWKADLLEVNGFDERMGYGGMDRELGERLVHAGVRPKQIRHRAVCLHLDHDRPWRTRETLRANRSIRRGTRSSRATWTDHGIRKAPAATS
jgi:glycosyltransferase involved in cell wall biosynthesis